MAQRSASFITFVQGNRSLVEVVEEAPGLYKVSVGGIERVVDSVELSPGSYSLIVDHRPFAAEVTGNGDDFRVNLGSKQVTVRLIDASLAEAVETMPGGGEAGPCEIKAMMPGRVVAILAKPGDEVEEGAGVLVIEAMKMENELTAPSGGKVIDVRVEAGQTVETGQVLAVLG